MSLESFGYANLIVFAAFLIRGFTGFGAALVVLPMLALWLPVKGVVVPLLTVLSLVNSAWLTWIARGQIDWRETGGLLLGGLPGLAAGLLAFHGSPDAFLRQLLGILVALVGIWLAWRGEAVARRPWSPIWGPAAGLLGGVLGGLFGASGPPLVLYLSGRPLDRHAFRATLLFYFAVADVIRGGTFAVGGVLTTWLWLAGLGLYPASLLGSWCGDRLQRGASETKFRRVVGALLVAVGGVLALGGRRP